ncbi:MAG: flippase-like domain-containing protein, partial [Bdellovibrionales bacterium]|nr:flippase-like domain-containing protein [Bdellovibrionales bacterium]
MRWGKLVVKFGLSFIIIGWMVGSGRLDLSVVKTGFSQGRAMLSVLALLVLALFIALYRWRLLLKGQGIVFEFGHLLRYSLIGCFFNTTMPGAVSGDIIKAWYVISENKRFEKTPVLTAILLDRAMGVFGLVTVAFVPLVLRWGQALENPQLHQVAVMILLLAAGVIGFFGYVML